MRIAPTFIHAFICAFTDVSATAIGSAIGGVIGIKTESASMLWLKVDVYCATLSTTLNHNNKRTRAEVVAPLTPSALGQASPSPYHINLL